METPVREIEEVTLPSRNGRVRDAPSRPEEKEPVALADVLLALPRGIMRQLRF